MALRYLPEAQQLQAENVLGYVEGTDLKDQLVIVTAHYTTASYARFRRSWAFSNWWAILGLNLMPDDLWNLSLTCRNTL